MCIKNDVGCGSHPQFECGEGPLKNVIKNVLIQLTLFIKDRHTYGQVNNLFKTKKLKLIIFRCVAEDECALSTCLIEENEQSSKIDLKEGSPFGTLKF